MCRLLPRSRGLPRFAGGSASAPLLSRPAQALLTLRPVGSLNRPRRPLSRGFDPVGYPAKPLVSYQNNRQLFGWNPPPLVVRAIGAHCEDQEARHLSRSGAVLERSFRQGERSALAFGDVVARDRMSRALLGEA